MRGHGEIKAALQEADEILVNSMVLGELRAGFIKGRRRRKNDDELNTFLASPRVKLLDVTNRRKIRGHSKLPLASRNADPYKRYLDLGHSMEHGLELLTTDEPYQKVPQVIVSYFRV